jgi:hypothetical protein
MSNIANKLSVVVTGNLIPSHPSITQIKTVIESLDFLNLDLNTKIILTHDEIKPEVKQTLRHAEQRFAAYLKNLQDYCDNECRYKNIQIVKREEWGHLTRTVQTGLAYVETEYILLLQHDLPFITNIDIYALLGAMINNKEIKHLRFNRKENLPTCWDGGETGYKVAEYLEAFKEVEFNGIKVCKTLAWSDENHLASKEYYETVVFPDCAVETTYTYMEGVLHRKNPDNPSRYGTYIYGAYGQQSPTKNTDGANTYLQDFVFDPDYCQRLYPDLRIFDISFKALKEMYVDRYGYIDCMDPEFDPDYYAKSLNIKFNNPREAYKHWLSYLGKKTGSFYAPNKHTTLKIILKTKDESFLIERWLQYHIALVGKHNILVIDNGSTRPEVLEVYKKYDILFYVHKGLHEEFHNSRKFLNFYEGIQKSSLFHTFLDTDEYLCFYDHGNEVIDNSKLIAFLLQNKTNHTLTTSWLLNNYYGKDYKDVSDVVDFSMDTPGWDTIKGKSIFLNNCPSGIRSHNSQSRNLTFCPELLLLHMHRACVEERIQSKIRYVKAEHPDWGDEEFFKKNEEIKETWIHGNREISEYYSDPAAYLSKLTAKEHRPYLFTDVVKATIEGREVTTALKGTDTLFPMLFNAFVGGNLTRVVQSRKLNQLLTECSKTKYSKFKDISKNIQKALTRVNFTDTPEVPNSLLKIIVKTKNEGNLLDAWLQYHAALVGWENLVVLDNGSDCVATLAVYEKYKDKPYVLFDVEGNPNILHDIKLNQSFYDLIRVTTKFVCFLDTDEFITYFDPEANRFNFQALLQVLQSYESNTALGGLWLSNSPRAEDLQQPDIKNFKHFKLNPYDLSSNILHGKAIVNAKSNIFNRSPEPGVNLCHNKDVPGVKVYPNLIILHLDKTDLVQRIARNLSIIKKRRLSLHENQSISQLSLEDLAVVESCLHRLEPLPADVASRCKKISYHKLHEIVNYLDDADKYFCSKAQYNSQHVLTTNVIQTTIGLEQQLEYTAVYKGKKINSLSELPFVIISPKKASEKAAGFTS